MIRIIDTKKNVCCAGFFALALCFILSFPATAFAAVDGAPENDSTFYVNLTSEGIGVPMILLPQELGVNYASQYFAGAMGVLVSNGRVVEETNPEHLLNTQYAQCGTIPGWTCSGTFSVSGTYTNGHLSILSTSNEIYSYDGTPIQQGSITDSKGAVKTFAPVPIAPGDVPFSSETRYECDVESASTFTCSSTRTFVERPLASCATTMAPPYPGAYGWDICAKAQYTTKPQQTKTGTTQAQVVALNGSAIVSTVSGDDTEVVRADGSTIPAKTGVVLKTGDAISTGYESNAVLDFGYATLAVSPLTHLSVNEFTNQNNIAKTQLYMRVGTVRAKLKQTPAIRSDFSVTTPGANAGIRGSEMQVTYDETTKETTVIVLEDKAYVKGTADANELEVPEKKQVTVDANGKVGTPAQATVTADTNGAPTLSTTWKYATIVIAFAVVIFVAVMLLRKKRKP